MSKRMIDSELIEALGTDIRFDGTGNVMVGKNLEVGGTTKLNGGLTPILIKNSSYQTPEGTFTYSITDYGEIKGTGNSILGLNIDGEYELLGFGSYNISDTTSDNFNIYGVSMVNGDFERIHLDNSEIGSEPIYESVAFTEQTQPKLYRHVISLSNDNSMYDAFIVYITTSNLKVDSLQDLTTLLNPTSNYLYPISGICSGLDANDSIQVGSLNAYIKSFNRIIYEDNTWYFTDVLSNKATIDTISDTVTPL